MNGKNKRFLCYACRMTNTEYVKISFRRRRVYDGQFRKIGRDN